VVTLKNHLRTEKKVFSVPAVFTIIGTEKLFFPNANVVSEVTTSNESRPHPTKLFIALIYPLVLQDGAGPIKLFQCHFISMFGNFLRR
jgi:hypothetical protein